MTRVAPLLAIVVIVLGGCSRDSEPAIPPAATVALAAQAVPPASPAPDFKPASEMPLDSKQVRIESQNPRYREERLTAREFPEMTSEALSDLLKKHIQRKWRDPREVQIGTIMDQLVDEEIAKIWDEWYLPALAAKVELREKLGNEAYDRMENEELEKLKITMRREYDRNGDGKVTLGELGDVAIELAPTVFRHGKLSWRTIIFKYLVMLRYGDGNGNGRVDSWEDGLFRGLRDDISKSQGNPDYVIKILGEGPTTVDPGQL